MAMGSSTPTTPITHNTAHSSYAERFSAKLPGEGKRERESREQMCSVVLTREWPVGTAL